MKIGEVQSHSKSTLAAIAHSTYTGTCQTGVISPRYHAHSQAKTAVENLLTKNLGTLRDGKGGRSAVGKKPADSAFSGIHSGADQGASPGAESKLRDKPPPQYRMVELPDGGWELCKIDSIVLAETVASGKARPEKSSSSQAENSRHGLVDPACSEEMLQEIGCKTIEITRSLPTGKGEDGERDSGRVTEVLQRRIMLVEGRFDEVEVVIDTRHHGYKDT